MRKVILALFLCSATLVSCGDSNSSGTSSEKLIGKSNGRINNLKVVVSNELWNGAVGEKIREHFAAATDGLPQQEPIFDIAQETPEKFKGFSKLSRTILEVRLGDNSQFEMKKDLYSGPQMVGKITANSEEKLIELIDKEYADLVKAFKKVEIKERQRRTNISLMRMHADSLKARFGISIKAPSAYKVSGSSDEFYWIRKHLKNGTTNILIYEVPLTAIGHGDSIVGDIINLRDVVGSRYVLVEDDSKIITEEAYAPYLFENEIDGKFAYETKGTWEIKDAFMAGPFVNYAVRDEKNQRYLVLEGFTYAPRVEKRDLQFELESILQSVKFLE
jgi:hypothetical protein